MRNTLIFSLTLLACLNSAASQAQDTRVVSGTILLNEATVPDFKTIQQKLNKQWKVATDSVNTGDKTLIFSAPGATVMLAYLDYPVAPADILAGAKMSGNWPNAAAEATAHRTQLVVSVIGSDKRTLDLYRLFTKVSACALENTRSSGVFYENLYLLVQRGYFLESARNMTDQNLPLSCWFHVILYPENKVNNAYTYGLSDLGLSELEVSSAGNTLAELQSLLLDVAQQLVLYNIQLKEGQTIQSIAEKKLIAHYVTSSFMDGKVFRLDFQ